MNFAVFVSSMAVTVFGTGSGGFGLLSSLLAIGSVAGALASARRDKPRGSCCSPARCRWESCSPERP